MSFTTNAFGLFYKRVPTGSTSTYDGSLPEFWFTASSASPRVSGAFLNFPDDEVFVTWITTRNSASNQFRQALPWGSPANDFLWNVTTPSWSYADSSSTQQNIELITATVVDRFWRVNLNSTQSFLSRSRREYGSLTTTVGVATYPVTSSWRIYDHKFISGSTTASFRYIHTVNATKVYPTFIGSEYRFTSSDRSLTVAYPMNFPSITGNSTGSIDGQYFDRSNGAGITRLAISQSLTTGSTSGSTDTATALRQCTQALKARRLFFPVPYSGSGTTNGTDYWFRQKTGQRIDSIFTENGGIYNIKFTLKRDTDLDCYPDNGTFMTAFIHNVMPQIPSSSARIPGANGWYPPDNNIVSIGNSYGITPVMNFFDPASGYNYEYFDFNLIQYGYPAQLCLEASGSLANDNYFGIIVNDIQICKIGVTTDPAFIKPQTIATTVAGAASKAGSQTGGVNPGEAFT